MTHGQKNVKLLYQVSSKSVKK